MNTKLSHNKIEEIKNKFQSLRKHKSEEDEIKHDAQMLMYRFLTEIQKYQDIEGVNRKTLAKLIKTSASYLTQLFRGNKPLNFETLAKCQKALNIKFDVIAQPKSLEVTVVDEEYFLQGIERYKTPKGYWYYKNFKPDMDKLEESDITEPQPKINERKKVVA
jgi:transcriptional regulator with XRE-family HTH domain